MACTTHATLPPYPRRGSAALTRVLRPPPLRRGDTIGVVATAAPTAGLRPRRLGRAVDELERLGYRVRLAPGVRERTEGRRDPASGAQRAHDIHAMIADDKVAAVMSSVGGRTTNGVVEHLDWDLIARRPKLLIGYSDFTVLQAAVWTETGLGGVYGPALLPQFGEPGGADPFSVEALERVVGCTEPAGLLGHPPTWATDFREWDVDDDDPRPRMPGPPLRTVRAGDAVGRLVPVNLDGLLVLAGTPWFPPLEGAVLAIEATNGTAVDGLCAGLVQLRHLGAFRRVAAVAFGRFAPPHMADDARLDGFLDEIVDGSAPVIAGLAFGHTDPMVSLPWGAGCAVRARPDSASVEILDPAVEDRR